MFVRVYQALVVSNGLTGRNLQNDHAAERLAARALPVTTNITVPLSVVRKKVENSGPQASTLNEPVDSEHDNGSDDRQY